MRRIVIDKHGRLRSQADLTEEEARALKRKAFTFLVDHDNWAFMQSHDEGKRSEMVNHAIRTWKDRLKIIDLCKLILKC